MSFKRGLYQLNQDVNFNFQLNRLINWDGGCLEEIEPLAPQIKSAEEWVLVMTRLAERAEAEGRIQETIAYTRMSEFFMSVHDPLKLATYRKARDLFYKANADVFLRKLSDGVTDAVRRFEVPYGNLRLPVIRAQTVGAEKGTIVLHGGNDSYMEELFPPLLYLAEAGYDVYLFEGPGQGAVLREQGACFTAEWEKPVAAVLDHFNLHEVTLIGVSLGGMLAPRAAAFESRIRRVVCWSLFPGLLEVALDDHSKVSQALIRSLIRCRCAGLINMMMRMGMQREPMMRWAFEHGMYAYGAATPYEYVRTMQRFQMLDIADKIKQDVLILQGKEDHFINWRMYPRVIDRLDNARSVSLRLFSREEAASDHCQCGNTRLALDTILRWLESLQCQ